ncbi:DUF7343 domain-containing protein [Methanocella sp. MCL-LM]|uniref:helix-turn-helix transcriptional regulator n=1 Tax=Methanocella sp. MCL-LM TaxID=3412035 RepID=UPI003C70C4A8
MSRVGIGAASARIFYLLTICATLGLLALPAVAIASSTVHGEVYDWATFDTMNNAVVEVYSMPGQTFIERTVVKTGNYSFDLPAGNYLIYAKAGTPGTISELLVTENITVTDSGDYTIDLILFPPTGLEYLEALNESDMNSTSSGQVVQPSASPQPGPTDSLLYPGIIAAIIVVAALVGGAYLYSSRARKNPTQEAIVAPGAPQAAMKQEKIPPREEAAEEVDLPEETHVLETHQQLQGGHIYDPLLPPDCRDVIVILEKNGGRITQLDLRKLLPYSEAKVSLIVSDLENRGLIKKIKKGRGNVLILNRPGEHPPEK